MDGWKDLMREKQASCFWEATEDENVSGIAPR